MSKERNTHCLFQPGVLTKGGSIWDGRKECFAIKLGIQAFLVHILERSFTMVTDHRTLELMSRMKQDCRLNRLSLKTCPQCTLKPVSPISVADFTCPH